MFFGKPFFKSNKENIEESYKQGVCSLTDRDFYSANNHFMKAATDGHTSALYNLALLNGMGEISPYDIDFAADCFYKTAKAGHPRAKEQIELLISADNGAIGVPNLPRLVSMFDGRHGINGLFMVTICRYFAVLCQHFNVCDEIIHYELDAASASEHSFIHSFIKRTNVPYAKFNNGLNKLKEGSTADQITDGFNNLHFSLMSSGYDEQISLFIRCTIVGYIISKSNYSDNAAPLLGVDKFFN